ncbi:MAG: hypothetical protein FWB72_01945 [Firmicutes bacterium]|nr:hypothetical protein [Bacillota bacterium]
MLTKFVSENLEVENQFIGQGQGTSKNNQQGLELPTSGREMCYTHMQGLEGGSNNYGEALRSLVLALESAALPITVMYSRHPYRTSGWVSSQSRDQGGETTTRIWYHRLNSRTSNWADFIIVRDRGGNITEIGKCSNTTTLNWSYDSSGFQSR